MDKPPLTPEQKLAKALVALRRIAKLSDRGDMRHVIARKVLDDIRARA